jgi:trans-2,3-dihydro-3-hydroxyanthranilate isomerase
MDIPRYKKNGMETVDVPFVLVDVFSTRPLEGNPLSLVPDADHLDATTMRRIAREFNQAESTFILKPTEVEADWRLRSFTPTGHEVFGAGHNALGAWWWLAAPGKFELGQSGGNFNQEIGNRVLPVQVDCESGRPATVAMTHEVPQFGEVFEDLPRIAEALGLEPSDFAVDEFKIQVVSSGTPHMLAPLQNREAIARTRPNPALLLSILASVSGQGCYLFSMDPVLPGSSAHARFFNPTVGIVEDAATGSAAGPLAAWLVKNGRVRNGSQILVEQGFAFDRPNLIRVRVLDDSVMLQ